MTETTSTAAMPNATDSATNSRMSVFEVSCAFTAVKNSGVGDDPAVGLDLVGGLNALRR